MKFKRLFTFGCSYTNNHLPTWSNIMSWDLGIPTQNWGLAGIGNVAIFHRMLECDIRNKFNEDDLILVLWSSWSREDRHIHGSWQQGGGIFSNPIYGEEYMKKYWSFSNDIIKNSTAIISANKMFNIQFQGHIVPIYEPELPPSHALEFTPKEKQIFKLYESLMPKDNVFTYEKYTEYAKLLRDYHPNLLDHLKYTKEVIYKSLNFTIKKETEDLCHDLHNKFFELIRENESCTTDEKLLRIREVLVSKNLANRNIQTAI